MHSYKLVFAKKIMPVGIREGALPASLQPMNKFPEYWIKLKFIYKYNSKYQNPRNKFKALVLLINVICGLFWLMISQCNTMYRKLNACQQVQ